MEFFDGIKKKLIIRNIIWMHVSILMMCLFVFCIVEYGFSNKMDYEFFSFGTDFGIPVPNWLMSLLFVFLISVFVSIFIDSLKSIIKKDKFQELLAAAQKIGDIESVGETLSDLPNNPLTKSGDLRFNNRLFFYLHDTDVDLIRIDTILSVQPKKRVIKSKPEFSVDVYCGGNKTIRIPVKEKNMKSLADAITSEVSKSRQLSG